MAAPFWPFLPVFPRFFPYSQKASRGGQNWKFHQISWTISHNFSIIDHFSISIFGWPKLPSKSGTLQYFPPLWPILTIQYRLLALFVTRNHHFRDLACTRAPIGAIWDASSHCPHRFGAQLAHNRTPRATTTPSNSQPVSSTSELASPPTFRCQKRGF